MFRRHSLRSIRIHRQFALEVEETYTVTGHVEPKHLPMLPAVLTLVQRLGGRTRPLRGRAGGDAFCADSGPSLSDPSRRALRPFATSAPGAPSVRFRPLVLRLRKPDDRLAVGLPASAQRRQPVRLSLRQPEQILTLGVAFGGIDDAARRQGSLDGAVGAGRHGDANQRCN